MKKLILFLIIFLPVSLLAQNGIEGNNKIMSDQLNEWMNKISSNSEMRSQMMDMIIEKTKGNKEEMMKLVDSFTRDPELIRMIITTMPKEASCEYSLQSVEITDDSVKVMKKQAAPMK